MNWNPPSNDYADNILHPCEFVDQRKEDKRQL